MGDLFAGIGGFSIAAHWTGQIETAWFSEVDDYASKVLAKNFNGTPNHGDITQIKGETVEPIDILCGGFPCTDISLAGKGAGLDGKQSGLWFEYLRLIDELRPKYILAENVSALRSRGLDRVLLSLHEIGYDAEWHCIPASAVGAPHQRDRIWIIAYPEGTHQDGIVGDAFRERLEGYARNGGPSGRQTSARSAASTGLSCGTDTAGWWASEPGVGRVVANVPNRVDRLRCLGNAIVPAVAFALFQEILEAYAAQQLEIWQTVRAAVA
jgi:DNA (cytosine-5)-methyltransferase 1